LKSQEPSNIREIELPNNSIGKIPESQENPHGNSTKEFCSCHDAPSPSPPTPSLAFQYATKRRGTQIRK